MTAEERIRLRLETVEMVRALLPDSGIADGMHAGLMAALADMGARRAPAAPKAKAPAAVQPAAPVQADAAPAPVQADAPEPAAAPDAKLEPRRGRTWTPEQRAAQAAKMRARMAALRPEKPQPAAPSPHAELTRAGRLAALAAKANAPVDPLADLPPDDLAEARQMIRSGKVGAKALGEYFGWEHDRAVAIAAALRDEEAAEAARRAA